jgi:hypothetical protein
MVDVVNDVHLYHLPSRQLATITRDNLVNGGRCGIGVVVHLDNAKDMLGKIVRSIFHREKLMCKVVRSTTLNGNLTDFDRLYIVHSIDNIVNTSRGHIEELLVEILIVHIALFVEMTPKVDIVDELLEFVLGHGLDTVKYGHS